MKVEVRLFATLAPFARNSRGIAVVDVPDGGTVEDVTRALGIPPTTSLVVLVNGQDVRADHTLEAGDVVDLFPPLAGG